MLSDHPLTLQSVSYSYSQKGFSAVLQGGTLFSVHLKPKNAIIWPNLENGWRLRARANAARMVFPWQNAPSPQDERHRYDALLEISDLVVRHHSLPELFRDVAARIRQVAHFQLLNFALYGPQDHLMHLHWWTGLETAALPTKVSGTDSPCGWVRQNQQELFFSDVHGESRFPSILVPLSEHGMRTYYVVPLTTGQGRLGALGIASPEVDAYGDEDKKLLRRVGELVALAVENLANRDAWVGEKRRLQAWLDVNRTLVSGLEVPRLLPLISECVT